MSSNSVNVYITGISLNLLYDNDASIQVASLNYNNSQITASNQTASNNYASNQTASTNTASNNYASIQIASNNYASIQTASNQAASNNYASIQTASNNYASSQNIINHTKQYIQNNSFLYPQIKGYSKFQLISNSNDIPNWTINGDLINNGVILFATNDSLLNSFGINQVLNLIINKGTPIKIFQPLNLLQGTYKLSFYYNGVPSTNYILYVSYLYIDDSSSNETTIITVTGYDDTNNHQNISYFKINNSGNYNIIFAFGNLSNNNNPTVFITNINLNLLYDNDASTQIASFNYNNSQIIASNQTASTNYASVNNASTNYASIQTASTNTASTNTASNNYASNQTASTNTASANYASTNTASANYASANYASANYASTNTASTNKASANYASANYASTNTASTNKASANYASTNTASANYASNQTASTNTASANYASSQNIINHNKQYILNGSFSVNTTDDTLQIINKNNITSWTIFSDLPNTGGLTPQIFLVNTNSSSDIPYKSSFNQLKLLGYSQMLNCFIDIITIFTIYQTVYLLQGTYKFSFY